MAMASGPLISSSLYCQLRSSTHLPGTRSSQLFLATTLTPSLPGIVLAATGVALSGRAERCSLLVHAVAEALVTDVEPPSEDLSKLKSESELLKRRAKRAELRRKRLVRKRRLRKKGRWPPSKVAKTKNV
eukprot:c6029_g1_i1 orf=441-830(-)